MKPLCQMPFMYHQQWRASTYDGHYPDQDSIDLSLVDVSSAGQPVFASAGGTVIEAHDTNAETRPYGSVVTIDHGDGCKTQYVHLDDQLSVKVKQTVVRDQKIGLVGTVAGLTPHLHYVQMKDGKAVRVTFNGVAIGVHAGAKKPNGTYPTEVLISNNCPTGITVNGIARGSSVTCKAGAGVRATVTCENLHTHKEVTRRGPWVSANATSKVNGVPGQLITDQGYEIS